MVEDFYITAFFFVFNFARNLKYYKYKYLIKETKIQSSKNTVNNTTTRHFKI